MRSGSAPGRGGVPYNGRPWSATASHNFNAPQPFTFRDGVRATYSFLLCSVVLVRCRFGLPRMEPGGDGSCFLHIAEVL